MNSRKFSIYLSDEAIESVEKIADRQGTKNRSGKPMVGPTVRKIVEFVIKDIGKDSRVQEIMKIDDSDNILNFIDKAVRGYIKQRYTGKINDKSTKY